MDTNKEICGNKMVVKLIGRLDTTNAPSLAEEIEKSIEGITDLTFDLSRLEYISSPGLRVLLAAKKTMAEQGKMVVCGVNETVKDVFEATGFDDILTIVE